MVAFQEKKTNTIQCRIFLVTRKNETRRMCSKDKKIFAIMQLPPPVHGQSIINQTVFQSRIINQYFDLKTLPIRFNSSLENIRKPSVGKAFKFIFYLVAIFKELAFFRPDLVYFALAPIGWAFYRDCIYVALIKLFQVPIIYHLHGKGINAKLTSSFNRFLYTFVFKNSKIILLSKLLKNDIQNLITDCSHIFYLPNGIEKEILPEKHINNPNKIPTIIFLSNIAKTKGILVLIKAAKLLIKRKVKFKLKIVGQIHQSLKKDDLLTIISDSKLKENIEYVGPKYGRDKYSILVDSDIFVFPTFMLHEAFPLVLLEAMQASLPVISTYEGAIPEIVDDGETGFIVKQKDSQDLAEKIEILLKNEALRKQMGRKAREKFLRNYSKDIFENNLNKIFHSILYQVD